MNIFVIFGQTATGKTTKAIQLAQQYDGEIINADSRQIYRHLHIVTGKDLPLDTPFTIHHLMGNKTIGYYTLSASHIKLWLYDIVDPKQAFSSAEYAQCALYIINDIVARGKSPILVGGTGFYLYYLLFGCSGDHIPPNWKLRKELEKKSVEELQFILHKKNPTALQQMNTSDRNNPRRLIRHIEKRYGEKKRHINNSNTSPKLIKQFQCCSFVPFFHQTSIQMRAAITQRVYDRIKKGAVQEVKKLLELGYIETDPGLNAIGYKQLIKHLRGTITLDEAIQDWITKEIQYAKRQKTYFKKYFNSP